MSDKLSWSDASTHGTFPGKLTVATVSVPVDLTLDKTIRRCEEFEHDLHEIFKYENGTDEGEECPDDCFCGNDMQAIVGRMIRLGWTKNGREEGIPHAEEGK